MCPEQLGRHSSALPSCRQCGTSNLTQRSRSGLTKLSKHGVGTCQRNELTRYLFGDIRPQSSQLAEPLWSDPGVKSESGSHGLISIFHLGGWGEGAQQARSDWSTPPPPPQFLPAREKTHHHYYYYYLAFDYLLCGIRVPNQRNREKWRKLVAKSSVVPQRPLRLRD